MMEIDAVDEKHKSSKRKLEQQQNAAYECLEDTIKRFRITTTPGELRLQKDIKEISNVIGVQIDNIDSSSVIIVFTDPQMEALKVPNRFLVTISRHYPHTKPDVKCLDVYNASGYPAPPPLSPQSSRIQQTLKSSYIDLVGNVIHPSLTEHWNAICSMKTIVEMLYFIRRATVS